MIIKWFRNDLKICNYSQTSPKIEPNPLKDEVEAKMCFGDKC